MSTPSTSQSTSTVHYAASTGYGGSHAANYHSIRPTYPAEIADYVLQHTLLSPDNQHQDASQRRILDVGCGTGKWTVALEAALKRQQQLAGCQLTAADAVESMTAALAQQLPHIPIHTAAASELPFPDAHFDLLTAATAFHWFCDDASVRCLHRVTRPGGWFVVLGYQVDAGEYDWTQPMQDMLESFYPPDVPFPQHNHWRRALERAEQQRLFEQVVHAVFPDAAVMQTNRAGLVNRLLSAGAVASLPAAEKQRVAKQFNAIIDADERLRNKTEYVMKDDIEVTILRRVQ